MQIFWNRIDKIWMALASVKLTIVILTGLLLLSIPGMVIMQYNISNIDPGIQYDYEFWKWGKYLQLFTAYHSFWFVGLMVILSMNLISCSVERWPQMYKLATAKPVYWASSTFEKQPDEWKHTWKTSLNLEQFKSQALGYLKKGVIPKNPVILFEDANSVQIFWHTGRWSRVANYVVHTSLLVIFAGAIVSALYGFEGAANIPSGAAVDTFLIFKEGKASGLERVPGGLANERMLGFRLEAESFKVSFYEDFPGRPKEFVSILNILDRGRVLASKRIVVNDPMEFGNHTIYQASYGRMGDFDLQLRVIDKKDPVNNQIYLKSRLGEVRDLKKYGSSLVPVRAHMNVQNLGPGVQFQELKDGKAFGEPFWVLRDYKTVGFQGTQPFGLVLDGIEERYFTGLQIGYDPGAPIYWFGCFFMLLGTFYALFVSHKKYYLNYKAGQVIFTGTTHRMPLGFDTKLQKIARKLQSMEKTTS